MTKNSFVAELTFNSYLGISVSLFSDIFMQIRSISLAFLLETNKISELIRDLCLLGDWSIKCQWELPGVTKRSWCEKAQIKWIRNGGQTKRLYPYNILEQLQICLRCRNCTGNLKSARNKLEKLYHWWHKRRNKIWGGNAAHALAAKHTVS